MSQAVRSERVPQRHRGTEKALGYWSNGVAMKVKVNGKTEDIAADLTLHQLLLALNLNPSQPGIAVALNREVVPRKRWTETKVLEDSEIEVIRAVQGG